MELKAVNEYKTPEYSTSDESKNKVFRFIMNCKKVSIGVLAMLLIYNTAIAIPEFEPLEDDIILGGLEYRVSLFEICQPIVYLISLILILTSGIIVIKNRKLEDEEKKMEIKRRVKYCIIWAVLLPSIFTIIEFLYDMFFYGI